jgi:hypothetical protein
VAGDRLDVTMPIAEPSTLIAMTLQALMNLLKAPPVRNGSLVDMAVDVTHGPRYHRQLR